MARINHGIPGGLSGKLGPFVASSWKGIPYVRSMPTGPKRDPSPAQLAQRLRFKTLVAFLKPFQDLVQRYFRDGSRGMTGLNAAISYHFRHALMGTYPDFYIDYSRVVLTTGYRRNVEQPAAEAEPGGIIWFHWKSNPEAGAGAGADKMILVAYCPELGECIYQEGKALRCDETATLDVKEFMGMEVETWISCLGNDHLHWPAISIYTGKLRVLP